MSDVLARRLAAAFDLHAVLAATLDEAALASNLGELPSNTIGAQFWCVVGARESYARAIENGSWAGFSCSLSAADTRVPRRVVAALESSATAASAVVAAGNLSEAQTELALQLLEHETQHHGQLIRFLYGLRLPIPEPWRARYSLESPH
jgi:hypothetical protein